MPSGIRLLLPERSPAPLAKGKNPYEERWIGIKDAVALIMRRRNVGPETAQSNLREACFSNKVRSRYVLAFTDRGGEKKIGFPALQQDAWDSASWPAPGFKDTELGVLMEPEVCHGEAEVYAGVQA